MCRRHQKAYVTVQLCGRMKRVNMIFIDQWPKRRHTGGMTNNRSHDGYIAAAPEQFRAILANLREQLTKALPDAEQIIKYDMPGFQIGGKIVAGYAAFRKQCGLYVDPGAIAAHADEIASLKLKATKTGITFSASNPITDGLVRKLAVSSRKKRGV
jgi:uncharacterized protein YdhG (YjbR/CyaY superfamily)